MNVPNHPLDRIASIAPRAQLTVSTCYVTRLETDALYTHSSSARQHIHMYALFSSRVSRSTLITHSLCGYLRYPELA